MKQTKRENCFISTHKGGKKKKKKKKKKKNEHFKLTLGQVVGPFSHIYQFNVRYFLIGSSLSNSILMYRNIAERLWNSSDLHAIIWYSQLLTKLCFIYFVMWCAFEREWRGDQYPYPSLFDSTGIKKVQITERPLKW